eukprot:4395667-Prymnesium_polylepis.2
MPTAHPALRSSATCAAGLGMSNRTCLPIAAEIPIFPVRYAITLLERARANSDVRPGAPAGGRTPPPRGQRGPFRRQLHWSEY